MANLKNSLKSFLKKHDKFKIHQMDIISSADVKSAEEILRLMMLATPEDYLLFFSSAVLLSAHVKSLEKQLRSKKNKLERKYKQELYNFKDIISDGIDAAIKSNADFLNFYYTTDANGKPVTYISLLGCQFSFHEVKETSLMQWARLTKAPQYQEQEWIYTPLQNGATTLFNFALQQDNITRMYFDGSGANPRDIVTKNRRIEQQKVQDALSKVAVQAGNVRTNSKQNVRELEG